MKHGFTGIIDDILKRHYGALAPDVFERSPLLQYLNIKTRSASRGSKSRGAFANHYALYVLVEDYIKAGFLDRRRGEYSKYEGARFTDLFRRQRELPFGSKLQNHALNARLNDEFAKYFPTLDAQPILRDQEKQRYWLNEQLIDIQVGAGPYANTVNIARAVIDIIDAYVAAKRSAFEAFLEVCKQVAGLSPSEPEKAVAFVREQLQPNVDARVFEIVSFAILKAHYGEQSILWGWTADELRRDFLMLYKTGRTNANDGGIDFVMKPLGRFFQVTETVDVNKYFLDIDKVQRFPITFVVKTRDKDAAVRSRLREAATSKYGVDAVVSRYMDAVEEIINIPRLISVFEVLIKDGRLGLVMDEIVLQSRVEFNIEEIEQAAAGDNGDEG
jgi:hypothetical protein